MPRRFCCGQGYVLCYYGVLRGDESEERRPHMRALLRPCRPPTPRHPILQADGCKRAPPCRPSPPPPPTPPASTPQSAARNPGRPTKPRSAASAPPAPAPSAARSAPLTSSAPTEGTAAAGPPPAPASIAPRWPTPGGLRRSALRGAE